MIKMRNVWARLRNSRGVSAIEYAILVGVIAVIVVGGFVAFGGKLGSYLSGLWGSTGLS